jgi:hypothetical protein
MNTAIPSAAPHAMHPLAMPAVECVTRIAAIERVFAPDLHLVVWRRAGDPRVAERAACWPSTTQRLMRSIRVRDLGLSSIAASLSMPAESPFAADVLLLAELFATIAGADSLGVRVDVTDRATCPRFHADQVTLRLMTTYRGPGTEWLQAGRTEQAEAGDVLFAKGDLWPDLRCGPCVHRSPVPASGQTRVLLTIDAL